jgi:hypothetical protein
VLFAAHDGVVGREPWFIPHICTQMSVIVVPPQTVTDTQLFEGCAELQAGGGFHVTTATGNVTLRANSLVTLGNDFSVGIASRLEVQLVP